MERKVQLTDDGSHTVAIPQMDVTYHSRFGALRESRHVFIKEGLEYFLNNSNTNSISIFEMGFGTGLNALLTMQFAQQNKQKIYYQSIELYPLTIEESQALNYGEQLNASKQLQLLHDAKWEEDVVLDEYFTLHKTNQSLVNFTAAEKKFDVVYYDAFAPDAQPELWTKTIFDKIFSMMSQGGVLATYCSKGDVRRAMLAAGFKAKKLAGPPGKIHILRAVKA